MSERLGIVLRRTEHHDEKLAELARAFARDLPGEVHVQLYVTPAGTQTFGWHFDVEDVFIAQTVGTKDYYFRLLRRICGRLINPHLYPCPYPYSKGRKIGCGCG